jgi:hypothetical protein
VQLLTATGTTARTTSDVNCPTDRFTTSVLKVSRSCLGWAGALVFVALTDNISFFFVLAIKNSVSPMYEHLLPDRNI